MHYYTQRSHDTTQNNNDLCNKIVNISNLFLIYIKIKAQHESIFHEASYGTKIITLLWNAKRHQFFESSETLIAFFSKLDWAQINHFYSQRHNCSQKDQPHISKSTHQIAKDIGSARDLSVVSRRTWTRRRFAVFRRKWFLMQPKQSDLNAADGCWDVTLWKPLSRFSLLMKWYFTRTRQ